MTQQEYYYYSSLEDEEIKKELLGEISNGGFQKVSNSIKDYEENKQGSKMTTSKSVFDTLRSIQPSKDDLGTVTKNGTSLTYISWAKAWEYVKKAYPDANYEVLENEFGLPFFDSPYGIFVKTTVTINAITHKMWLPVMNNMNKAVKSEPYEYSTKAGKIYTVEAATTTDINTALMRCLVKNIAMHGLFLHIYSKDELPSGVLDDIKETQEHQSKMKLLHSVKKLIDAKECDIDTMFNFYRVKTLEDMNSMQLSNLIKQLEAKKDKETEND